MALLVAFGLRDALAWGHASPDYLPDEYQYTAIARSLASSLRPDVRGESAHFTALLAPILTAPAWVVGSVATDFRVAQAIGALAMTLAAVPVYLLGRRIGLTPGLAYAAAALALVIPDMIYAGFMLSEPFAYPLVLAACLAGTAALTRPTRRNHILFLVLAVLAVLARTELAVLPAAFVVAVGVFGVCEGRLAETVRAQRLPLAVIASGAAITVAAVLVRGLGYYSAAVRFSVQPGAVIASAGQNTLTLVYASGWVLIPGAILGAAHALARPRQRAERAFAVVALTLGLALVAEAAVFGAAWGPATMVQERYTFYLLPPLALFFGLYASRGLPLRRLHALLAAGLLLLAVSVPLSGLAEPALASHSPFLWSVMQLEVISGGVSQGSVIVLVAATALAVVAAIAPWLGRRAVALLITLGLLASGAGYVGAWWFDRVDAEASLRATLPVDTSWIDDARLGEVTLIATPGGSSDADEQLFWNRSIDRVGLLPGASRPDAMASEALTVGDDGVVRSDGRPLRGPVAIDDVGSTVLLAAARRVSASPDVTLWRPAGVVRLRLAFDGRAAGGSLSGSGRITLWRTDAPLAGRLTFSVRPLPGRSLKLLIDGRLVRGTRVSLTVCGRSSWSVRFVVRPPLLLDMVSGSLVGGSATIPVYVPDPSVCAAGR